ncbi:hypothetical protein B6U99_02370 [Candidatus Geothermarchaeota archaeon ex4572_27]|nr:MAG: hypothetical protein B6U99_02370 [Candidatus Geothermarchaeota archaeon ex4572_27]
MGRYLEVLAVVSSIYAAWFTIGIYAPYLPLYAYYVLGASNFLVGLLATVYFGVNAPSSVAVGYLVDRYGGVRAIMIAALTLMSTANAMTVFVPASELLLLIRAAQGFSSAAIIPLSNLLGSELFGPGRGIGIVNTVGSAGFLSASVLGGFLVDIYGYHSLFVISAVIPALSTAILAAAGGGTVIREPHAIRLSDVRRLGRVLAVMYVLLFMRQLGAAGVWSLFSLFIYSLGGDNVAVGLAYALNTMTQVLVFERMSRFAEGRGLVVFEAGLLLSSLVFVGYYLASSPSEVLPVQVVLGVSWAALYSGITVYVVESVPQEVRATGLGLIGATLAMGWVLGSAIGGAVADMYQSYKVYILAAALLSFTAFAAAEVLRRLLKGGPKTPGEP